MPRADIAGIYKSGLGTVRNVRGTPSRRRFPDQLTSGFCGGILCCDLAGVVADVRLPRLESLLYKTSLLDSIALSVFEAATSFDDSRWEWLFSFSLSPLR